MKAFGIILLILGIIMTVTTGFTITTKKEVVDFGFIEIRKEKKTPIYWSPLAGGILIAVGAIAYIAGEGKKYHDKVRR